MLNAVDMLYLTYQYWWLYHGNSFALNIDVYQFSWTSVQLLNILQILLLNHSYLLWYECIMPKIDDTKNDCKNLHYVHIITFQFLHHKRDTTWSRCPCLHCHHHLSIMILSSASWFLLSSFALVSHSLLHNNMINHKALHWLE